MPGKYYGRCRKCDEISFDGRPVYQPQTIVMILLRWILQYNAEISLRAEGGLSSHVGTQFKGESP